MNHPVLLIFQALPAVQGISQHIEQPSQGLLSHGHGDSMAGGRHFHIPAKPFAGGQHNAADRVVAHMLSHLHHGTLSAVLHGKGVLDLRKGFFIFKFHIYHRSHDLYDLSNIHICLPPLLSLRLRAADHLGDLLGDGCLAHPVVLHGQIL